MELRVVLIDDDERFRAQARRSLHAEGVDVVAEVASGADAVEVVARWKPDVALVDILMPEVDGLEVARQLQETDGGPAVILISTRDKAYGDRLASTVGARYLPKDQLSLAAILPLARPG